MERLPNEIWLKIVAGLEDSHQALATFARLCRKAYHLAKPRLYTRLPPPGTNSRISPLLVRTLCENAAIAELVRYGEFPEEVTFDFQSHEVMPAVQACTRLPDDFKSDLIDLGPDANEDDEPDWVALLVALLPNLEELAFQIAYDASALTNALSVNRLPRLRKISTYHWDTEWAADMEKVMPELFLVGETTLETYEGHANDWSLGLDDDGAAAEPPDGSSSSSTAMVKHRTLRNITLQMSVFDTPGLARLLAACPRLAALRLHWGDACTSDSSELDLPGTGRAIREHAAAGLEVLMLNPRDHFNYGDEPEGIGSLRNMKRLRELHLSHDVLAGVFDDENEDGTGPIPHDSDALVRLLPASLEELYLEARLSPPPPRVLAAQVRRLVDDREGFPVLRRVELAGLEPARFDMGGWADYGWMATVMDVGRDASWFAMPTANRICLERMTN